MFRKFALMFAAGSLVIGFTGVAGATTTLKVGTIAPGDSTWGKEFKKLAKQVSDDTNGELQLEFLWNGQAGDENLEVQKIRSGQLDMAAVTSFGLAQTGVTDITVFQIPGLFQTWAKLDQVRDALKDDFSKMFEAKGFTVLGWGDVGAVKQMTVGFEIHHPSDLQGKGVFFYSGDPIAPKLFAAVGGVTPKQLTIAEVLPQLSSGAINVVNVSPLAAEQIQWGSRITHMCNDTTAFAIGATIASSARLNSLPPKFKQVIIDRVGESAARLTKQIRNLDAQAFARMKQSKKSYDLSDAEKAEWKPIFVKVAKELRGSVISPPIFDKVMQLAGNPLAQ